MATVERNDSFLLQEETSSRSSLSIEVKYRLEKLKIDTLVKKMCSLVEPFAKWMQRRSGTRQQPAALIGFIYSLRHETSAGDETLSSVSTVSLSVFFFSFSLQGPRPEQKRGSRGLLLQDQCPLWLLSLRIWLAGPEDRGRLHSLSRPECWPMFTRSESCCLFGVFSLLVARHYFGTLTLGCGSTTSWCGLAFLFLLLHASVSHRVSLPLPFSPLRIEDRAPGLDTKRCGQLFALPAEWGVNSVCRRETRKRRRKSVKIFCWCVPEKDHPEKHI